MQNLVAKVGGKKGAYTSTKSRVAGTNDITAPTMPPVARKSDLVWNTAYSQMKPRLMRASSASGSGVAQGEAQGGVVGALWGVAQ